MKIMRKGYLEDIIRSVKHGKMLQMQLSGVNEKSYRSKVAQINRKDGYKHYSIAINSAADVFFIKNNGDYGAKSK